MTWTRLCKKTLSSSPYGVTVVAKIRTHQFEPIYSVLFELICPPVDCFFTQKALLTSMHNLLVLFIEQYLQPWMSCRGINVFRRIRIIITSNEKVFNKNKDCHKKDRNKCTRMPSNAMHLAYKRLLLPCFVHIQRSTKAICSPATVLLQELAVHLP